MKLDNAVVLVTGANRGLGLEFTRQALAAGARKVYAAARDPSAVTLPGVVPLRLDVNDPAQVARAAADCGDVTLVVNNAGIARMGGLLQADSIDALRTMFDTNVVGILHMSQAFAPKLAPAVVVERAYAALARGQDEVLIDELSQQVKQGLTAEPSLYLAVGTAAA